MYMNIRCKSINSRTLTSHTRNKTYHDYNLHKVFFRLNFSIHFVSIKTAKFISIIVNVAALSFIGLDWIELDQGVILLVAYANYCFAIDLIYSKYLQFFQIFVRRVCLNCNIFFSQKNTSSCSLYLLRQHYELRHFFEKCNHRCRSSFLF